MSQSETQHSAATPDNAEELDRPEAPSEADRDAQPADQASVGDESEQAAGADDALSDDQLDTVAGGRMLM